MLFETERLVLIPLTLQELILLRNERNAFEKQLNCTYMGEPIEGFIYEYLEDQIRTITANENSYLYYAFWMLLRKSDRVIVGSAAFKGLPNQEGELEIGYGLGKEFEHNGYMTEAVAQMCNWGLAQDNVKHIIAETDIDGLASQRILQRNGFVRYHFGESSWWRLS
jgi:RimJ/RimL family protein N-acetyltransferase